MSTFIVERTLPGITTEQLTAAAGAAKSTAAQMTSEGQQVQYLRSTFVPEGERCYCLFDAPNEATVKTVQERAGLPFDRILPAAHLSAADLP